MKKLHTDGMNRKTIGMAVALVVAVTVYRVFASRYAMDLPNFSPVMAMAFCCGLALPGMLAVAVPLGCLFISDLILNASLGQPLFQSATLAIYACYLFAIGTGFLLRDRGWLAVTGTVVGNAVLFYLVTNTISWAGGLDYPQNFAGWLQSQTVGLPGFPPSWMFFRNAVISDLAFTGVFCALLYFARKRSASPSLCRQESSS